MTIRSCIIVLALLLATRLKAQTWPCTELDRKQDSLRLAEMQQQYGQGKQIPASLQIQALRALSAYPDLVAAKIVFKFRPQKTAHSARPSWSSVFRKPAKRKYIIFVSSKVPDFFLPGQHFQLPYTAQVGVLGHELAHVQQYHQSKGFQLAMTGIRYFFSKKQVIEVEHKTDSTAINHGLGCELWAWSKIARPLLVEAGRGQNYLKPEEIEAILKGGN